MKILIVEDHAPSLYVIEEIVKIITERYDTNVIIMKAKSVTVAMSLIHTADPDIILVDWHMYGGPSGESLVTYVKSSPDHKHRYVIMVTANKFYLERYQEIFYKPDDVIIKPLMMDKVEKSLEVAINHVLGSRFT